MPTAPIPDSLYNTFGIDARWDDPHSYTEAQAADDNGRYPPDWDDRRNAALHHYRYRCARCGRRDGNVNTGSLHVHHYVPLSSGGTNELSNLMPLCGDCHSLMHPGNGLVDGDYSEAPIFPYQDADLRVAVVRKPRPWDDLDTTHRRLLTELGTHSLPVGKTTYARSELTYHLNPEDAIAARDPSLIRKRIGTTDATSQTRSTSKTRTTATASSGSRSGTTRTSTGSDADGDTIEEFDDAPLWMQVIVLALVPFVWLWDLIKYTCVYGPLLFAGGCILTGGLFVVVGIYTFAVAEPAASIGEAAGHVLVLVLNALLAVFGYKSVQWLRAHEKTPY